MGRSSVNLCLGTWVGSQAYCSVQATGNSPEVFVPFKPLWWQRGTLLWLPCVCSLPPSLHGTVHTRTWFTCCVLNVLCCWKGMVLFGVLGLWPGFLWADADSSPLLFVLLFLFSSWQARSLTRLVAAAALLGLAASQTTELALPSGASFLGVVTNGSWVNYNFTLATAQWSQVDVRVNAVGTGDVRLYAGVGGSGVVNPNTPSTYDAPAANMWDGESMIIVRNTSAPFTLR